MRKLCFHWDGAEAFRKDEVAKKKLLKQWTHTAKAFGIFNLIVIGDRDAIPIIGDIEVSIEYFDKYSDVRDIYPDEKYVVLTEKGKREVEFPEDCIFVVGSNYADPQENKGDILVGIKSGIPLWDVVAAGIILHKAQ